MMINNKTKKKQQQQQNENTFLFCHFFDLKL
jgi:hypothetical protein